MEHVSVDAVLVHGNDCGLFCVDAHCVLNICGVGLHVHALFHIDPLRIACTCLHV